MLLRDFSRRFLAKSATPRFQAVPGKIPYGHDEIRERIISSMKPFSFEVTPAAARNFRKIMQVKGLLPRPNVYITLLPGGPLKESIECVNMLKEKDFVPVPHLPARSFRDINHLSEFLSEIAPIENVLVTAGSRDPPIGDLSCTMQILEHSNVLEEHGVRNIGLACHPQGASNIEDDVLEQSFKEKLNWAHGEGGRRFAKIYWVSQLCYSADVLIDWEKRVREEYKNDLPVAVGLSGPAQPEALVKFAKLAGVTNSVKFLSQHPRLAVKLVKQDRAVLDDIIVKIANYMKEEEDQMFDGFHFYSFGALNDTLDWVVKAQNGLFQLTNDFQIELDDLENGNNGKAEAESGNGK